MSASRANRHGDEYAAEIVASEVLRAGSESGLALTFRMGDGVAPGTVWRSVIRFASAHGPTQHAGQQALADLCAACGHREPLTDPEVLHGIPLRLAVEYAGGALTIAGVTSAPTALPWGECAEWPVVKGCR